MKKIKTEKEFDLLTDNVARVIEANSAILPTYRGLHFYNPTSIEKMAKHINNFETLKTIVKDSDVILICGHHASGKRDIADALRAAVLARAPSFTYEYRELRERLQRDGMLSEKHGSAGLRGVESALLSHAALAYAGRVPVMVVDPSHNTERRASLMRTVGASEHGSNATAIILLGDYKTMEERNKITHSQQSYLRSFEEYFNQTQMSFPRFSEGFRNVVVINETTRDSLNYIPNSKIAEEYNARYQGNIKVFDHSLKISD